MSSAETALQFSSLQICWLQLLCLIFSVHWTAYQLEMDPASLSEGEKSQLHFYSPTIFPCVNNERCTALNFSAQEGRVGNRLVPAAAEQHECCHCYMHVPSNARAAALDCPSWCVSGLFFKSINTPQNHNRNLMELYSIWYKIKYEF